MLVLSRGRGQEIVIDSNIRVRIGEIVGGRVKLLIDAPRECLVRRSEVSFEVPEAALIASS
jgi:carbon storage regulator